MCHTSTVPFELTLESVSLLDPNWHKLSCLTLTMVSEKGHGCFGQTVQLPAATFEQDLPGWYKPHAACGHNLPHHPCGEIFSLTLRLCHQEGQTYHRWLKAPFHFLTETCRCLQDHRPLWLRWATAGEAAPVPGRGVRPVRCHGRECQFDSINCKFVFRFYVPD